MSEGSINSTRVVVAAGGTGGHLFPAQAVASSLQQEGIEVHFLAKGLHTNRCFMKSSFTFLDVEAGQFSRRPLRLAKSIWRMIQGLWQASCYFRKFRPQLVIGFGSYHTVPVLAAARALSIPIILHEANARPGKVNRLFSPGALWTGIFFDEASKYLKGKTKYVDMPLRSEFMNQPQPRKKEARLYYGLQEDKKTVLVLGGSQGARRINEIMVEVAPFLAAAGFQVLHFTGSGEDIVQRAYAQAGLSSYVAPFETSMPRAYAAADLAVCRAGASTIAELLHCELPALYIPYPYAQDDHQKINADYAALQMKAGSVLLEQLVTKEKFCNELIRLSNEECLKQMQGSMRAYRQKVRYEEFISAVKASLHNLQEGRSP